MIDFLRVEVGVAGKAIHTSTLTLADSAKFSELVGTDGLDS